MLGFLNLHKPSGLTSHDCVAKVRKLLKIKKVGHGGTLDPLATGVLPIAVGKATRLLSYLPKDKSYQARVRFGVTTSTDDLEGEVIQTQDASHLSLEAVAAILPQFIGEIEQIPPAYSAISVGGKRLYELARKGETVEVPLRKVKVESITILDWHPRTFPEIDLAITCGPGTYIRAIARDLGNSLGVGATLASLLRTGSCGFSHHQSVSLTDLAEVVAKDSLRLISPDQALQHLPQITLPPDLALRWSQGQKISLSTPPTDGVTRVSTVTQKFLGIGTCHSDAYNYWLVPKIVF